MKDVVHYRQFLAKIPFLVVKVPLQNDPDHTIYRSTIGCTGTPSLPSTRLFHEDKPVENYEHRLFLFFLVGTITFKLFDPFTSC